MTHLSREMLAEGKRLLELWNSESEGPAPVVQWRQVSSWFVDHAPALLAAAEASLEKRPVDYRDCLELAGAIASAVEFYEGDDLLSQIIPVIKPLIGENLELAEENAHMRTTDAIQDRAALLENTNALAAEVERLKSEAAKFLSLIGYPEWGEKVDSISVNIDGHAQPYHLGTNQFRRLYEAFKETDSNPAAPEQHE